MLIGVTHTISDPEKFFAGARDVLGNLPKGLACHQVLPAVDGSHAHCLWEAASVDEVRDLIDPATVGIADNEYFEIDTGSAIGLR
ncbi:hypothetical protein [Streptacidiphilus melanogenes]|uniref:hypothetical protein n=1 Tax=Streptacidiphilus melanogenes TaxID=411235 RepID=UPI000A824EFC|nr:hypothetical protein [Streptacidiphilus melanogenes]